MCVVRGRCPPGDPRVPLLMCGCAALSVCGIRVEMSAPLLRSLPALLPPPPRPSAVAPVRCGMQGGGWAEGCEGGAVPSGATEVGSGRWGGRGAQWGCPPQRRDGGVGVGTVRTRSHPPVRDVWDCGPGGRREAPDGEARRCPNGRSGTATSTLCNHRCRHVVRRLRSVTGGGKWSRTGNGAPSIPLPRRCLAHAG